MKSQLTRIAVASLTLLLSPAARAQYQQYGTREGDGFRLDQTLFLVNWELMKAVGSFHDYTSDWSLRGFSIEGRRKILPNISVGASFSYNRWNQTYGNLTVDIPNGVISGPVYRYADVFAIRALGHYYFSDGPIQPYAGVGIGGAWSYSFQQIADLGTSQDGFHFIVDPEVGILVQLMRGRTSLDLNVAFRYTFTTADVGRVASNAQWISPVVGLGWAY